MMNREEKKRGKLIIYLHTKCQINNELTVISTRLPIDNTESGLNRHDGTKKNTQIDNRF